MGKLAFRERGHRPLQSFQTQVPRAGAEGMGPRVSQTPNSEIGEWGPEAQKPTARNSVCTHPIVLNIIQITDFQPRGAHLLCTAPGTAPLTRRPQVTAGLWRPPVGLPFRALTRRPPPGCGAGSPKPCDPALIPAA